MFKNINYESREKVLRELKGLASKKLSEAKSMPKELYTSNEILELENTKNRIKELELDYNRLKAKQNNLLPFMSFSSDKELEIEKDVA